MPILDEIAGFVVSTEFEHIPDEVVDEAKFSILDTIGSILVGEGSKLYELVAGIVIADAPQESTVFPVSKKTDVLSAIQVNCSAAHCSEIDNIHPGAIVCLGGMVVPAALAWAEKKALSGKDLLTAVVIGSEVCIRLGASARGVDFLTKGWWPSSLFGPMGVCAAIAKLERLSEEQTKQALSICSSLCGGLISDGPEGATARHFLYGWTARCGAASVLAAKDGFTGSERALEIKHGLYLSRDVEPDFSNTIEELGNEYRLSETMYKSFASAMQAQSAISGFVSLVEENSITEDQIEQVIVELPEKALFVVKGNGIPDSHMTAAAHGGYLMAIALADGDVLPKQFEKDRIFDPEIRAFMERVTVRENKALEKHIGKWPARIVIRLKDDSVFEVEKADWMDGYERREFIEKKFERIVSVTDKAGRAGSIKEAVNKLEKTEDTAELLKAICG